MTRPASPLEYATQRPSGENTAPMMVGVWTPPKGSSFRLARENVHSEEGTEGLTAANNSVSSFGDHDSGTCAVPLSGLVSRSAVTGPVRELPEDRLIAVPVRLKCHALTIA